MKLGPFFFSLVRQDYLEKVRMYAENDQFVHFYAADTDRMYE